MSEKTENITLVATVAKVIDQYQVVINRGTEQGVNKGDRFLLYGIGEEIKDPETGDSLGALEIVRGTGIVTHVQPAMATIKSTMSQRPPPTTKKITRPSKNTFRAMVYGFGGEEIIEEREGESEELPFEDAQEGDKAKPI